MIKGIDVSSYQPNTLGYFQSAKALGYDFAIVKLTDYTNYVNPSAQAQVSNATKAGLSAHAFYHYEKFYGSNSTAEANFFVKELKKIAHLGDFAFLDYELAGSSISSNDNAIINFLTIVKNAGYRVGFYSYYGQHNYWNIDTIKAQVPDCLFWLANYGVSQPGLNDVDIWQYNDNGVIAGIDTDVNYDFFSTLTSATQAPKKAVSKLTAKITYNKSKVNLLSSKGKYLNKYLNPGTSWIVDGAKTINKEVMLQVATDMYLPLRFTSLKTITISYIKGYGINAWNSKGKQVADSNTVFKDGTSWKVDNIKEINSEWCFLVGKDEYVPQQYVK